MKIRTLWRQIITIALAAFCGMQTMAAQVNLNWTAPVQNVDTTALNDLAGFKIYHGLASGIYSSLQDVGNVTATTIPQLAEGVTHYFAITAYNIGGTESTLSDEIIWLASTQTVSATQTSPGYRAGSTATLTGQFSHPPTTSLLSLLWRPSLPAGWTLIQASGDGAPEVNGNDIVFGALFTNTIVNFQYEVGVPAQTSGDQTVSATAEYMLSGMANPSATGTAPVILHPIFALDVSSTYGGSVPQTGNNDYTGGTIIAAAVTNSPVAGSGGTRYVCTGWSGTGSVPATGSGTAVQFTLVNDSTLNWNWSTQFHLTANASTNGQVSPTDAWYSAGTTNVSLLATANADYHFTGWTGDVPASQTNSNPVILTMDMPRSITATFGRNTRTLAVTSARGGAVPAVGTNTYPYATLLSAAVTNSPVAGSVGTRYVCTGWSGTGSVPATGSGTSATFTLTLNSAITWLWKTQYRFTTTATNGGTITASGDWIDSGAAASATAIPLSGFVFAGWNGNVPAGHEMDNPIVLTMTSALSLAAQFQVDAGSIHADHTAGATYRSPSTNSVFSATFSYPADTTLVSLTWQPVLPQGWTILSATGGAAPIVAGSTIVFTTPPTANPVSFQYTVSIPGNAAITNSVSGAASFQLQGMTAPVSIIAAPAALTMERLHSADYDVLQNWNIDGAEVSRVLAYWRAGGYRLDPLGYDGFSPTSTPDTVNTNGGLHSADFQAPYGVIDGAEVSRVLAYWRAGGYRLDPLGYDGYAPASPLPAQTTVEAMMQVDSVVVSATPVVTQEIPQGYRPGATLTITNTLTYNEGLLSLCWRPTLPAGWEVVAATGDGRPELVRNEILWTGTLPPSPIHLVYTITVPVWAIGDQQVGSAIEYQPASAPNPLIGTPDPSSRAIVATDADENGLADGWEAYYADNTGVMLRDDDDDGDGMSNLAEFLSGTAPNDAGSVLAMASPSHDTDGTMLVSWQSAPGRTYTLQKTVSLREPFLTLQSGIAATPPMNSVRDLNADSGNAFYRIQVNP